MDYIPAGTLNWSPIFALSATGLTIADIKVSCVRYDEGDGTSFVVIGPTALTALATTTTGHTDNYGIYLDDDATGGTGFLFRVDVPDTYGASGKGIVIVSLYNDGSNELAHRVFRLTPAPVNLVQILGTTLTETSGYIAAGFKKLFNVASPVLTAESVNQTGDNFARIGANGVSLTDLGGMSTGMKAEVNAEADAALTDYDPPTKAEMDTMETNLTAEIDANEVKIDAVKVDTAAVKLKTDDLTYSVANKLDSNIHYVNDIEVTGDGESGTEWGPA